ncbi:membrane-bound lytic murein transglycosylase C [Litorivivens lipolytica]|uniref:Membrane-bound lytic murein transglycosylase C n=1 Tax=Litorivivens lipolytica TaxID=1524264 RepID=A0A7W4Z667_9GAMM|nr:membrane-bound lytic murein transglycosylase C [Litorivivens lipolytica]
MKRSAKLLTALLAILPAAPVTTADIWGELEREAGELDSAAERSVEASTKKPTEFELYKKRQQEEFAAYRKIFEEELDNYKKAIKKRWPDPEVSSQKVWVSYTQDYAVKRAVDFESNTLTISAQGVQANQKAAVKKFEDQIRQVLTTTVSGAFETDQFASAVEARIKREGVKAKTSKVPNSSIFGLSSADKKKAELLEKRVKELASKLELKRSQDGKAVTASVDISKVLKSKKASRPNAGAVAMPARAEAYADRIVAESQRRDLETSLVLAVIQTESAFNPMARSGVPAYGLMQIVPKTAGLDATEYVYGKQTLLAPSALYNPDQNIELGAAYLWILNNRYLKKIEDPLSRYYCVIAAYNTGAGNVAKAFTGKRNVNQAAKIINKMSPEQVYNHLIKNLPYEETQNYLKKVVRRAEGYKKASQT